MALVGWVRDPNGCPYMDAYVRTPPGVRTSRISFLVDTGAKTSFLMPMDARALGVDYDRLTLSSESTTGIGGEARYYQEQALVTFFDSEYAYVYELGLELAEPTEHNVGIPSLLGRDILSRWLLRYEAPRGLLTAEVDSADLTVSRTR